MSKNFSIIGPSGYIGARHLKTISQLNGKISSYLDIQKSNLKDFQNDPIFFNDPKEFSRYLSKENTDYLVICSPNFLHFKHINIGLKNNLQVICEKPITLSYHELKELSFNEKNSEGKVFTIYQLRLHKVNSEISKYLLDKNNISSLSYIAERDEEYFKSWKVDPIKSGGILNNLGIHYFDFLISHFGYPLEFQLYEETPLRAEGSMTFKDLHVDWIFSIDPKDVKDLKRPVKREFSINNNIVDFSGGFDDLHLKSYQEIILGNGFGIEIAKPSVKLIDSLRGII